MVRLRAELERVNAEIAALKRQPAGVRADYLLRQRMADAEGLARRLTDAEAALPSAPPSVRAPLALPRAETSDGPAELQAKADILADEAQRLTRDADRLARGADVIRGREALRRRMGRMEADPFTAFEASKRSLVFSVNRPAAPTAGPADTKGATGTTQGPAVRGSDSAENAPASPGNAASPGPPAPAAGSGSPGFGLAPGAPTATATPTSPVAPTPTATGTPPVSPPAAPTTELAPSVTFRALLDPATLGDLRRLEAAGTPAARAEAASRAAAALRTRAAELDAQSRALRNRAQTQSQ